MPAHFTPDLHLYFDIPTPIFRARINQPGTITYPATTLTFDTVTLGAFGDIQPDMTLILGTTLGADDLGRVRVPNVATSTTIPVGRVSQGTHDGELNITDNAFVEVWEDYRVWAKIPFDDTDSGIDYKDSNVEVGDFNVELPPVSNCGVGAIDYVNPGTGLLTVQLPMGGVNESYTMADGATIVTYAWDLKGGTATVGTVASAVLTATFPAGKYWVVQTITDSNGKQHSSRCRVVAIDPDDDPTTVFTIPSHRIEKMGQTISFGMPDSIPRTTYPDGSLVILFDGAMLNPGDRSNIKFYGWHQSDSFSIRATPQGLIRDTVLNCVDVAGRLAALPGFPQALQREPELDDEDNPIDIFWALMPTLDMRKCLHYLAFWHSTALQLADFFLPDSLSDYPAMRLDSTGASLYEQINSRAQSCVPDHWLTCNTLGQLSVLPDWMLLDFADRPVATAGTLTEDFWSDIRVDYTRPPRVYVLNSGAVICSTDWITGPDGEDTLPLAFCVAPGPAFGQGVSEATTGEKLTISQEQLNHCEGHRYARLNARYGLFSIVEPSGDIQAFEPAAMLPVQLNISAATAAQRGLDFTTARGLVKSIDMRYTHTEHGTWVSPTIQWEKEVIGLPAVTHIPEVPDDPDFEVPEPPPGTVPPDNGLREGVEVLVGIGSNGHVYQTVDFQTLSGVGGPTYTDVDLGTGDLYSFVADPFSPGCAPGATSGSVDGFVVGETDIYRVEDLHGTPVATSVHTFAVATSMASFHWRSIQASFGAYFSAGSNPWLLCISDYGDTAGHTGIWAKRSTDGGVTWEAEVQISAHYDQGIATRFNPIGVWTSPRTPGLARTAAYIETAIAPLADGYQSTDWGATWSRMSADAPDDAVEKQPRWYYWGEGDVLQGTSLGPIANHSAFASATGGPLDQEQVRIQLAPPKDAVRVVVEGLWSATYTRTGGITDSGGSLDVTDPSQVTRTGDPAYVDPGPNASTFGGFSTEFTLISGTDWPFNRELLEATPPTVPSSSVKFTINANVDSSVGNTSTFRTIISARVALIELDGGAIYEPPVLGAGMIQPGQSLGGSIHFPWPDNADEQLAYYGNASFLGDRQFRLRQANGTTQTDISPDDTGVFFGVNVYGFAVRSFDEDRQFMAVAGIGNDTSDDPADDTVGLWVSSNAAVAWVNILAPVAASNAPRGLQIAFSGNSSDVLFAWGGISSGSLAAIYYTDDFGTLDDRTGNLESSFGDVVLIGLAGGPTP